VEAARRGMADKPNGDTRTRRPDRPPAGLAPLGPPVAPAEPPTVLAVPPEREAPGGAGPLRSGFRDAYALLVDLRGEPRSWIALMLASGVLLVIILNMVAQVRLNTWQGDFFNAIERKDLSGVGRQLLIFLPIAGVLLCLVVAQTWMHEMLKVRIRATVTRRLLDVWLSPKRAYRLGVTSALGVNPDQRMQEDVRHLAELTADLGIGFVHHVLLLGTFVGVLWVLSSGIALPIGGGESIVIPGYMVWAALLYAGAGSWLAWRIGRPLIRLHVQRYEKEAEFRFALVRVSESAEAVALYGGERDERRYIDKTFGSVLTAMRRVVFAVARLTWITSGYGWIAIVVPTVVALPGYFYGGLTLGGLMMVVGAFNQVQQALRWFVDNYARIADWRASLHRVVVFDEALKALDDGLEADVDDGESRIEVKDHPEGRLAFRNVSVLLADGRVLIKEATSEFRQGDRVLIVGESGSGKSTLFRAIAGLWPWGTGTILLPPRESIMFMPQRPYLPLGTLRTALAYPSPPDAFSTEALSAALERVHLPEYAAMLDREERWDRLMSMGEQQRLAFARLLLQKPRWIFLDEATAALDDENQARVMSIFDEELAGATLISIGHRAGLERYHTKTLELAESTSGERLRLRTREPGRPKSRLFRRLRTLLPQRTRKSEVGKP
jgi:putative ATP-binding cassette transporter